MCFSFINIDPTYRTFCPMHMGWYTFDFSYMKSYSISSIPLIVPPHITHLDATYETICQKRNKHVLLSASGNKRTCPQFLKASLLFVNSIISNNIRDPDANTLLCASLLLPVINGDKYETWSLMVWNVGLL